MRIAAPSDSSKIDSIMCEAELSGFEGQIVADKRMTPIIANQIAMRRNELRTIKGWK